MRVLSMTCYHILPDGEEHRGELVMGAGEMTSTVESSLREALAAFMAYGQSLNLRSPLWEDGESAIYLELTSLDPRLSSFVAIHDNVATLKASKIHQRVSWTVTKKEVK